MPKKRDGSREQFISNLKTGWVNLLRAVENLEASPNNLAWLETELTPEYAKSLVFVLHTAQEWTLMASRALEEPEVARRHRHAIEDEIQRPPLLLPMAPSAYPPSRAERNLRRLFQKSP